MAMVGLLGRLMGGFLLAYPHALGMLQREIRNAEPNCLGWAPGLGLCLRHREQQQLTYLQQGWNLAGPARGLIPCSSAERAVDTLWEIREQRGTLPCPGWLAPGNVRQGWFILVTQCEAGPTWLRFAPRPQRSLGLELDELELALGSTRTAQPLIPGRTWMPRFAELSMTQLSCVDWTAPQHHL